MNTSPTGVDVTMLVRPRTLARSAWNSAEALT